MKTINVILGISLVFALISCGGSKQKSVASADSTKGSPSQSTANAEPVPSSVKKYPVKSAIVTFESDMMGIKVKTVLYFDDYGIKETEETFEGDKLKEADMCDGKMRYGINYEKKTAFTKGTAIRGIAYKFDWDEISKADQKYKVKKLANVTIAGKDCESYSLNYGDYPTVFAGWNNILLYQETKSKYGTIVKKTVKLEENATVPADKFVVPQGFSVVNN